MSKYTRTAKSALVAIAAIGATSMISAPAQAACGPDQYIGSICFTAGTYCPRQYPPATGAIVQISDNNALFSLLGCQFGGDCRVTFALPDLRGRVPIGEGQGPGLSYVALAQQRGAEARILTTSQLAQHSHTATFTPTGGGAGTPITVDTKVMVNDANATSSTPDSTNNFLAAPGLGSGFSRQAVNGYNNGSSGTSVELGGVTSTASGGGGGITGGMVTVDPTGDNKPVYTTDPSVGLTACIAVQGVYPPRS